MRVDERNKQSCCGCTVCSYVCPKSAINMVRDEFGFAYPQINDDRCINCGLCEKICSFGNHYDKSDNLPTPDVYGLRNETSQLERSQSGGAFISIASAFISNGGIVYGVAYDSTFEAQHIRGEKMEQCELMHGSKYVQSNMGKTLSLIERDLRDGKKVLFSGTPCQIAGVKSYVRFHKLSGLYTIDILCHGVGSPRVWRDNLSYVRSKLNGQLIYVNMRDKKFGWRGGKEVYRTSNKELEQLSYTHLYFEHYIHRECCLNCPFTNTRRTGDISIGDFWGWEKSYNILNDNKGVSLVLVNTEHGKELLSHITDDITLVKSSLDKCMQNVLDHPVTNNVKAEQFRQDYLLRGYKYVIHHYGDLRTRYRLYKRYLAIRHKFKLLLYDYFAWK